MRPLDDLLAIDPKDGVSGRGGQHDKEWDNNCTGADSRVDSMFHFSVSFCGPGNQHVGSEPDAEPVPGANSDVG